MVRLNIYEPPSRSEKPEEIVRLRLLQEDEGLISLVVCDEDGDAVDGGILMEFSLNENGKITARTVGYVNPDIPIERDAGDALIVECG